MANIKKGILGGVSGKVGSVVGGSWKGRDYLRSLPTGDRQTNSVQQQLQQQKFKTVIDFVRPMLELVRVGFHAEAGRMSAYNAATSYIFKHALTGDADTGFSIDYSKALLAKGSLPGCAGLILASTEAGILNFNWRDNSAVAGASPSDVLYAAVYCPAKTNGVANLFLTRRDSTQATLELPDSWRGETVQVYVGFLTIAALGGSPGRNMVSESQYAGEMLIA